jgi:hypothetical protein
MNFFSFLQKKALIAFFSLFPLIAFAENSSQYSSENNQYRSRPFEYSQSSQNDVYANQCCETSDSPQCCESNGFWDTVKVPLIGIVAGIGGGIIGAEIIGNDRGHHGHDGSSGSQGPAGPAGAAGPQGPGFPADTGQTLTFTLTGLFPASPLGSVTARPFVTGPNGVTIEGPAVVPLTGGGTINFAPIVFPNPPFGFYNFGLSITNTSAVTLAGITLNGTLVTASRDGSVTSELTPLAGVSISPGESQISSTFTYDTANVP